MLEAKLTTEQKVEARISPVNAAGEKVSSKASWTVVEGDGTVEVSKDGLSAYLVSGKIPGDTLYLVTVTGIEGEKEPIYDSVRLVAFGSNAERVGLSLNQPVSKSDKTELAGHVHTGNRHISGAMPGPREE